MQVVHYAAGDWGVGELWLDDDGRPVVARAADDRARGGAGLSRGAVPLADVCSRRTSPASASRSTTSSSTSSGARRCSGRSRTALRRVPYGETVTYGELAALAGRPQAPRAGGAFCSQNRLPLILPCHRVVAAGGIGGYGSLGVEYKRRMLELEGAAL